MGSGRRVGRKHEVAGEQWRATKPRLRSQEVLLDFAVRGCQCGGRVGRVKRGTCALPWPMCAAIG